MGRRPARSGEAALVALLVLVARDAGTDGAAAGACRVDVSGPPPVRLVIRTSRADAPERTVDVGADGAWVPVGASPPARGYATSRRGPVWPRSAALVAGGRVRFQVEPLREVSLVPGDVVVRGVRIRWVPDRSDVPDGPAERVDALQAWVDQSTVTSELRGGGVAVVRLPATSWWGFGAWDDASVVLHLSPGDRVVRVLPVEGRAVVRGPTLLGRPVPRGTLVAPGRLDLAACAAVRTLVELRDFPGAALTGGDEPPRVAVTGAAAGDVTRDVTGDVTGAVTLWHPSFGVAHTTWTGEGLADAAPHRGVVEFTVPGGRPFTGNLAVWPAWTGTADVFSRPSDRHLRRRVRGGTSLTVRGLPPGSYRYDYAARAGWDPPAAERLRKGEVVVGADRPARILLEPDP
jgi:hypothetical protein